MEDYILKCENIRKEFPGVIALDNVEFSLKKGEVHAICGENGAGKSTLIKIITGLYEKNSGRIVYEGKEENFKNVQECRQNGISLIPQEIHMAQDLTVAENVMMTGYPKKGGRVDWGFMRKRTFELQKKIGIENYFTPDTIVGTLSMGHQQLIEVMKAISTELKVIAFDEPTSSLSDDESERLFELIDELKKSGVSIIYVSHRLPEIFRICDRITVFKDGKYISTDETRNVTPEMIVSKMVGREMAGFKKTAVTADYSQTVLQVKNLKWKNHVKGVSFDLHKGEILGLFGIVGSGRTETARCIFGLEKPDAGEIIVRGNQCNFKKPGDAIAEKMGFVTEDRRGEGLSTINSIEWNMTMPYLERFSSKLGRINHKKEKENTTQLSKELNIKAVSIYEPAVSLSGGNQQKIVIAKWIGADSDILIFDEPTRGIDVGAKAEIYLLMEELAKKGKSIIMISSELPELLALSDRILVYRDGVINHEFTDVSTLSESDVLHYAILADGEE